MRGTLPVHDLNDESWCRSPNLDSFDTFMQIVVKEFLLR
jgi:hypothetical protein